MNSLNSVLVEGTLTADPVEREEICKFKIESCRYCKQDDEQKKEIIFIPVEVHGDLAINCSGYLKAGSGVRVVGRIKQEDNNLLVFAEHVEFKPVFNKKD